ncbi:5-formyltetrahydrofolate cyclo-ligase isoform X3 [Ursus maritimus]|nr:5-formyltetrahydrofolate cyclo-ligase isoform X3 [Ursus maritimus]
MAHSQYQKSRRISIFLSMQDEVETKEIIQDIFRQGKTCFIPRYQIQSSHMDMVKLASPEEISSLPRTSWNIHQPGEDEVREEALSTGLSTCKPPDPHGEDTVCERRNWKAWGPMCHQRLGLSTPILPHFRVYETDGKGQPQGVEQQLLLGSNSVLRKKAVRLCTPNIIMEENCFLSVDGWTNEGNNERPCSRAL